MVVACIWLVGSHAAQACSVHLCNYKNSSELGWEVCLQISHPGGILSSSYNQVVLGFGEGSW